MARDTLALMCFLAFNLVGSPAFAARYVPIRIYLNGELILEGNASDNGDRDADSVWDDLGQVNLGETEAFIKRFGKDVGGDLKIWNKLEGQPPLKIKIYVAYGGEAVVTAIHVKRQPPDRAGRVWRIQPKDVVETFNSRLIRRSDAARLSDPQRVK